MSGWAARHEMDINGRSAFFDGTAPLDEGGYRFPFLRRHTRTAHLLTSAHTLDESRCAGGVQRILVGRSVRHPNPLPNASRTGARSLEAICAASLSSARGGARRTLLPAYDAMPPSQRVPGEGEGLGKGGDHGGEERRHAPGSRERSLRHEGGPGLLGGGKGRERPAPFPSLPVPGSSGPQGRGAAYPVKGPKPSRPSRLAKPPNLQRPSFPSFRLRTNTRAHFSLSSVHVHSERCSRVAHSH